jgi:hypothetical protein
MLVVWGGLVTAYPAAAITYQTSTPISGDVVPVTVSLSDVPGGGAVNVTVSIPQGDGDLLGFFGTVSNKSLVPQMSVTSTGIVTQWQFAAGSVSKVGGGNTMAPVNTWDFGLQLGHQGSSGGPITSASFQLLAPGLTSAQLTGSSTQGWIFGIRIQSTPGPTGSSKIGLSTGALGITITSPAAGLLTNQTQITVTGTVTGTAPITVSVNGVQATVSGSSYTARVPLVQGLNTLTATATNSQGSASAATTVTLDTTLPVVTITAPPDGTDTTQAQVTVTGTVADAVPISSFTLNGQAVPLTNGSFSTPVSLVLGANPIVASATDVAGNAGSAQITVTLGTAPTVSIATPANGSLGNQTPIAVSGTFSGTPPVAVTVNGTTASLSGSNYTASLGLAQGANTLTATATNVFGTASASVTTTLDTVPPVVTISTPANGSQTSQAQTPVTGTVTAAAPIQTFTVNGQTVALTNGAFSTTLNLAEGANPITATATDVAGNTGSAQVTVTRGDPPTIAISSPANGSFERQASLTVTGSVTGTSPLTVTVNGTAATVSGGGFTAPLSLAQGANPITATAANAFGSATASVTTTLNTTPPVVTIAQPANGATFTTQQITVSGTVTDSIPIAALSLNGSPLAPGNAFSTPTSLSQGSNTFTVQATDAAGNVGAASVAVTYTPNVPLSITIATPPNGAILSSPAIPVAGTVSASNAHVAVNGFYGVVTGTAYVAPAVVLQEGPNVLVATATLGAQTASAQVTVTFHKPPQVLITSPPDGVRLLAAQTDVLGVVDELTARVDVNGVLATVGAGGKFTAPGVPLQVGPNLLTARAVDPFGAQGTDHVTVTRDDGATPLLRIILVDPTRFKFNIANPGPPQVVIAHTLQEFMTSLTATGVDASQFVPPISDIAVGLSSVVHVYVFAESAGDVTIPQAATFNSPITQTLQPISGLAADLSGIGLDPGLTFQLLPTDFEAQFFARFDLLLQGPPNS